MATLEQLLLELSGVLPAEIVVSPAGLDVEVSALSIYDTFVQETELSRALLLGIGLSPAHAVSALGSLGPAGAAALLLKVPPDADRSALAAAGERAGVAVLTVPAHTAWIQVQSLVMAAVAGLTTVQVPHDPDDRDPDDLFAIADTVADLMGAPILVQDRHMHLLAFSSHQEEADAVRIETILQRGMPPRYARQLEELKILQRVFREQEPVFFEPLEGMEQGRVAMAVRSGNEVLGTITAAVRRQPSEEQRRTLHEAAKLVALSMLRQRALEDTEQRYAADLVDTLLEGGVAAAEAADQLGLEATSFRVLAAGVSSGGEDLDAVVLQRRLAGALRSHLSLFGVTAATALLGSVVYVVVTDEDPERDRQRLVRQARIFTSRGVGHLARYTLIGIGGHAPKLTDIPRSRREADDVLRVLRSEAAGAAVAEIDDVRLRVWLRRLRDMFGDDTALGFGSLSPLIEHDAAHGTDYLETLRAYLEAMGDTARMAEDLCVHVNTVRYRLRKLEEFGLELDNPERRLELQLRLRLLAEP